jgi:hypothetical protein
LKQIGPQKPIARIAAADQKIHAREFYPASPTSAMWATMTSALPPMPLTCRP